MKGVFAMELAKVTSKGQITIPIEIRRKLGIKEGDKVLLIEEQGRAELTCQFCDQVYQFSREELEALLREM